MQLLQTPLQNLCINNSHLNSKLVFKGPFNTTFLHKNLLLSTHFLALGSMLSWKTYEENIVECWKRQRKKRYLFCFHMFCL